MIKDMEKADSDDNKEYNESSKEEKHDQKQNDGNQPGITFFGDSDVESVKDMFPSEVKRKKGKPRK